MTIEELIHTADTLEARIQAGETMQDIQHDANNALQHLQQTTESSNTYQELECRISICIAITMLQQGVAHDALPILENSLQHAESLHNKVLQAKALGYLGIAHEKMSNYPLATEYYHAALELDEELQNTDRVAVWLSNLGIVHATIADYTKAIEYFTSALQIDEQLHNTRKVINTTGNIGLVYYGLKNYPKALEYLQRSLEYETEMKNTTGIARHSGSIGSIYTAQENYTKALEYYNVSLQIYEEEQNKIGISITAGNMGNVYYKLAQYGQSLEHYQKALVIDKEIQNKNGIARHTGNIGSVYANTAFELYNTEIAERTYSEALQLLQEIGAKKEMSEMHLRFANLYEAQERWKEFAYHYKTYHALEKEVESEETVKKAEQFDYERQIAEREKQLAVERSRSMEREHILNNILPQEITSRLIQGENPIADHFDSVSILFMDIVGFTKLSAVITAQQLVYLLNIIFTRIDTVIRDCGLEKIKTIGDAYMAVAGAPIVQDDHAHRAAKAALQLLDVMNDVANEFKKTDNDNNWIQTMPALQVRIGLHCGPVAAGVVGENKFLYDLWGDAVNTASRMESHGEPGKVHVSEEFAKHLTQTLSKGEGLPMQPPSLLRKVGMGFVPRGEMEIKGKGRMKTYFLERADGNG
ncbi:MAG: tetratricopeptide repeat protein [Bacteriodetes bacterium]|nr:tetratricopeptide repeat protein [Bacteroidota bacterium]